MRLSTESILGWTRVSVLLLAMGWAAWMDHKDRRVGNDHWLVWVKPALFLWALDLIAQEADWTVFLTASAVNTNSLFDNIAGMSSAFSFTPTGGINPPVSLRSSSFTPALLVL